MTTQTQERLERVTIYLTRKEKRDAQIAAAHLELNMATLGRKAIQYLIYAPLPQEATNEAPVSDDSNGKGSD